MRPTVLRVDSHNTEPSRVEPHGYGNQPQGHGRAKQRATYDMHDTDTVCDLTWTDPPAAWLRGLWVVAPGSPRVPRDRQAGESTITPTDAQLRVSGPGGPARPGPCLPAHVTRHQEGDKAASVK